MPPAFDPLAETIGLLEQAADQLDRSGRPGRARGHRRHAAGLRAMLGAPRPPDVD